ncbi:MAG: NAD(+) synthase [Endomicrobia bacterium]|nr:NAD(+) synthase [Endomicrobiia bacterium]
MKIAIAQINTIAGDIKFNSAKIREYAALAKKNGAELAVFPELSLPGGFAGDLYLRKDFLKACEKEISVLAKELDIPVVLGSSFGGENAVIYIDKGRIEPLSFKILFGREKKYFNGNDLQMSVKGFSCCIYSGAKELEQSLKKAAELQAETLLVLANEPFYIGVNEELTEEITAYAEKFSINIAFINGVGAQDGFVSFGSSFAVNKAGFIEASAKQFEEDLIFADFVLNTKVQIEEIPMEKQVYDALVLGLKDYAVKNGFKKFVLGVSGGADSALTAVIAKDAFGAENVTGIFMPSDITSKRSRDDAELLCKMNNIKLLEIPISKTFKSFKNDLSEIFKGVKIDVAEENLQSRIRGVLLMAYSNKFNALLMTSGNRSEIASGYCTLYGDCAGGYAVICDLPKSYLYKVCDWRNSVSKAIPKSVLEKEPTAELRENQKDSDSLPPYDILDGIIDKFADSFEGKEEIVLSEEEKQIFKMISLAEYKRRQLPLGTKLLKYSLKDIQLPVTNGYKQ